MIRDSISSSLELIMSVTMSSPSGPWHFALKLIVLQPWKEGSIFSKSECRKVPIWVKFSHIPLSYWTPEGISYLASGIGKSLFADEMT